MTTAPAMPHSVLVALKIIWPFLTSRHSAMMITMDYDCAVSIISRNSYGDSGDCLLHKFWLTKDVTSSRQSSLLVLLVSASCSLHGDTETTRGRICRLFRWRSFYRNVQSLWKKHFGAVFHERYMSTLGLSKIIAVRA